MPLGIAARGFGLYEAFSGKGDDHTLALDNGIVGSWLASVGVAAGKTALIIVSSRAGSHR